MAAVLGVHGNPQGHWVGDGFPVRSLFSHATLGQDASPFLLLDYAGPAAFPPAERPRGVGSHPHRGFETVTIVYQGEVDHRDSEGHGGRIGPGDVQWMTAASGILHEEFHSPAFTRTGGVLEMVQLWVNLPARDKLAPPGYQTVLAGTVPTVGLPGGGTLRVIAGAYDGREGPARTFTPLNVWDVRLTAGTGTALDLPAGHVAMMVVLHGPAMVHGTRAVDAQLVLLDRAGGTVTVQAEADAMLLVLTGEPIDEPVVMHGPFVMNTREEILQAHADFQAGRLGQH